LAFDPDAAAAIQSEGRVIVTSLVGEPPPEVFEAAQFAGIVPDQIDKIGEGSV
jgi:hypothetical protein